LIGKGSLRNISHGMAKNNPLGFLMPWKGNKKIVFRIDGLREIYAGMKDRADEVLVDNLDLADSVVFQSLFSRDCFDKLKICYPQDYCIIYNGANEKVFYPANNSPGRSNGVVLVSNSWSVNPRKGFETISLFSELENVSILHIGRWPEGISSGNVRLMGTMSEEKVAQTLRSGHFFLFPSECEACPNVVLEALASGLPVLYSESGGTPELFKDGDFGIVLPSETKSLKRIQTFMEEAKQRYVAMRGSILGQLPLFSFKKCFDKYVNYFQTMIN